MISLLLTGRFDNPTKLEGSPAYSIRDELIKALASNKTKRTELQDAEGKIHLLQKELESFKVSGDFEIKNRDNECKFLILFLLQLFVIIDSITFCIIVTRTLRRA